MNLNKVGGAAIGGASAKTSKDEEHPSGFKWDERSLGMAGIGRSWLNIKNFHSGRLAGGSQRKNTGSRRRERNRLGKSPASEQGWKHAHTNIIREI
jgi:hypothetical protein